MSDDATLLPFNLDDLLPSHHVRQQKQAQESSIAEEQGLGSEQDGKSIAINSDSGTGADMDTGAGHGPANPKAPDLAQQVLDFDVHEDGESITLSLETDTGEANESQGGTLAPRTLFGNDPGNDALPAPSRITRSDAHIEPEHHYMVGGVEVHDVELIPDDECCEQLALDIPVLPPIKASARAEGRTPIKSFGQAATNNGSADPADAETTPLFE